MTPDREKAIILLSGGLDSATCLAVARERGYALHALSFRYGQRHALELEAARRVAESIGVTAHQILDIDLGRLGGSALTTDVAVPKDRDEATMGNDIPVTYVPARNTIFLAYALAWAEVIAAEHIFIGVNALDYSGYPDCRPEFIAAFEALARVATKESIETGRAPRIETPLISMTKRDIIRLGTDLGVDYGLTTSCYDPDTSGLACGRCDACALRLKGFRDLAMQDPIRYQNQT